MGRSVLLGLLVCGAGLACHDLSGLAGKQQLPSGVPDPNSLKTRAGALAAYQSVLSTFQASSWIEASSIYPQVANGAFVDFVLISGLLTDELESGKLGGVQTDYQADDDILLLDTRRLPEGVRYDPDLDRLYTELQAVRNSATLAIGALATYDTVDSPALRGQLYALQGYSELFLADLYCSGVPLSTLDFEGDFTYHAGSTTTQLYQAAIAKFDTAVALSNDSARILNLARVGKGRAYLALARYDSAAAAVDSVTTGYSYQFLVNWHPAGSTVGGFMGMITGGATEADTQGTTGLPYLSSGDPRTAAATWGTNRYGVSQYAPIKYGGTSLGSDYTVSVVTPITVASGIEARLIQAEAAYHGVATGTGDWLAQLNVLRQTAITPALPVLSDPGSSPDDTARVNLLFRERAYWLFLTGQRQGDLRRLIRSYQLDQTLVYPTGAYPLFGAFQQYGTDVTVPIPPEEHTNPLFTGCLSRGA
jgi:hypothetical protein